MKRSIALFSVLAGFVPVSVAAAADVSGYLVLTSDYVWRGVTQSDSHGAVQLGGDLSFDSGLYTGVWGSTVDIDSGSGRQRDYGVNYYAGFSHGVTNALALGINAVAYTYPGTTGDVDYDYVEYSVSANYEDRVWLEYSFSPDIYNTGADTHNVDLYTEWPVADHFDLSAGVGFYDASELSGESYEYWQVGITRNFSRADVDFRYHDTSRWVRIISSRDRADARLVLSLRFFF